ncbi:MAG: molybdopterin-guanine dinucleotide biosynthesis protein B [Hyphomicrobiales bacterium]
MRAMGIAGWSGAGKTTLLSRLIPVLVGRGFSVSTIKHAHHHFDVDYPGKDSHTHRVAGATEVLVSSMNRFALMHELRGAKEPNLAQLLLMLAPVDFVLVEGFKPEPHPKIEVHRLANGKPFLYPNDPTILALASDAAIADASFTVLALENAEELADFVQENAVSVTDVLRLLHEN